MWKRKKTEDKIIVETHPEDCASCKLAKKEKRHIGIPQTLGASLRQRVNRIRGSRTLRPGRTTTQPDQVIWDESIRQFHYGESRTDALEQARQQALNEMANQMMDQQAQRAMPPINVTASQISDEQLTPGRIRPIPEIAPLGNTQE